MSLEILNTKTEGDSAYIAGLGGQLVGLYAPSLWAAKQMAVERFKPEKCNAGLLWVELAVED